MSRTENVDTGMWDGEDWLALSPEAKLLYFWSFTTTRCGMSGIYPVAHRSVLFETGLDDDQLTAALTELRAGRYLFHEDGWLWVRARVKRLHSQTEKIAKSILSDLRKLPAGHPFRESFAFEYEGVEWGSGGFRGILAQLISKEGITAEWRLDGEGQVTLTRGSGEGQERVKTSLTEATFRPSPEGQERVQCQGQGQGKSPTEELRTDPLELGKKNQSSGRASVNYDEPPADFPDELRPVLDEVVPVLQRIAAAKESAEVKVLAVARAVASYPRRDHRKAAGDLEQWLCFGTGQNRAAKDVVGFFRNQLDRLPDLAAGSGGGRPLDRRPSLSGRSLSEPGDADLYARTAREMAAAKAAGHGTDTEGAF